MRGRVLVFFCLHIRVIHPTRQDLNLAAAFPGRPVDQIHRAERRLDLRLLRVLFDHDVSVADTFARRLNRECSSAAAAIFERVKRKTLLLVFVWTDIVVSHLDGLQSESLRQIRRNKANDLQLPQVIQRKFRRRTYRREREQEPAQNNPRRSFYTTATGHSSSLTDSMNLSRIDALLAALSSMPADQSALFTDLHFAICSSLSVGNAIVFSSCTAMSQLSVSVASANVQSV